MRYIFRARRSPPRYPTGRRRVPLGAAPVLQDGRRSPAHPPRRRAGRRTRDRPPRTRAAEVDPAGTALTLAPNPPKNDHRPPPAAGCWPTGGGSCDNCTCRWPPPRRPEARRTTSGPFFLATAVIVAPALPPGPSSRRRRAASPHPHADRREGRSHRPSGSALIALYLCSRRRRGGFHLPGEEKFISPPTGGGGPVGWMERSGGAGEAP